MMPRHPEQQGMLGRRPPLRIPGRQPPGWTPFIQPPHTPPPGWPGQQPQGWPGQQPGFNLQEATGALDTAQGLLGDASSEITAADMEPLSNARGMVSQAQNALVQGFGPPRQQNPWGGRGGTMPGILGMLGGIGPQAIAGAPQGGGPQTLGSLGAGLLGGPSSSGGMLPAFMANGGPAETTGIGPLYMQGGGMPEGDDREVTMTRSDSTFNPVQVAKDYLADPWNAPSIAATLTSMISSVAPNLGLAAISSILSPVATLVWGGKTLYDAVVAAQRAANTQEIEPGWGGLFGEKGDPNRTKDDELTDKMLAWENPNWGKPSAPSWGNMGPPGKDPGPWGPLGDAHFAPLQGIDPSRGAGFDTWAGPGWGPPGDPGDLGIDPTEDAAPGEGPDAGDAGAGWGGWGEDGGAYYRDGGLVRQPDRDARGLASLL